MWVSARPAGQQSGSPPITAWGERMHSSSSEHLSSRITDAQAGRDHKCGSAGAGLLFWLCPSCSASTMGSPKHPCAWLGVDGDAEEEHVHPISCMEVTSPAWQRPSCCCKMGSVQGWLCPRPVGTAEHRRHGSGATGIPSSTDRAPCLSRCPGHGLQKASPPLPPRNEVSTASSASSPQIPCVIISLPRSTRCQRWPERDTELLTLPRISSRAVITLSSGHREVLIGSSTAPGALLKPPHGCLYRAAWLNLTARRSLAGGPRGRDRKAKTPWRTGMGRLRAGQARRGFMQGII